MSSQTDVLIFAEDAGAANYVGRLPALLHQRGWRCRLLAAGSASAYLRATLPSAEFEDLPPGSTARGILSSISPRLVLVGTSDNPDTLGLALVATARSTGLTTVGAVDALANAAFRFRGRTEKSLAFAPDWLLVPDDWTREAYAALGYAPERAVVCGHPHHDFVRETAARLALEDRRLLRASMFPRAPADRPVVVFLSERTTGLDPQQYRRSAAYTLHGRGGSVERTDVVLEEFLDAAAVLQPRPHLVLRLHPGQVQQELERYVGDFDALSEHGSPLTLVYAADVVVGMTTALLFEAALMARPTLSIVPRASEREWLPSIRAGMTPCVSTRQAVRHTLARLVQRPGPISTAAAAAVIPADSSRRTRNFLDWLLRRATSPAHECAYWKG